MVKQKFKECSITMNLKKRRDPNLSFAVNAENIALKYKHD